MRKRKVSEQQVLESAVAVTDHILNLFGAVHQYSYDDVGSPGRFERQTEGAVSLTMPGMVMSMAEIMKRFTKRLPIPVMDGVNVDIDVSDFDRFNKFELIDYSRKLSKAAYDIRHNLDIQMAEVKKNRDAEAYQAKLAEGVAEALKKRNGEAQNAAHTE